MSVFERYTKIKEELKITQTELAEANNVSQPALSGKESRGNISIATLEHIRKHYNVNINWLLSGEGDKFIKDEGKIIESLREELQRYKDEVIHLYRVKDDLENQIKKIAG
jgi:transcriptional regulator with XRE-family HTH domain